MGPIGKQKSKANDRTRLPTAGISRERQTVLHVRYVWSLTCGYVRACADFPADFRGARARGLTEKRHGRIHEKNRRY